MRPTTKLAGLALALLTLCSGVAQAAPGDLDPSFDGDGRRVLPFGGVPAQVLVQPDGKIVLAGYNQDGNFAVWRLLAGGALDRSFDGDGTAVADLGGTDIAYAAALQPDGKIVVAGSSQNPETRVDMAVARFTTEGELDPEFDPGGTDGEGRKVFNDSADTTATAVAVQGDGKLVLGGVGGEDLAFGLRRLKADGTPDGTAYEELEYASTAAALVVQPDGAIVAAGTMSAPEAPRVSVVARYAPGGTLDETFALGGWTTLGPEDEFHTARLLVQPDGRLLVLGSSEPDDPRMVVARLTRRGEVDGGFGTGGFAIPDFDGQDLAAAIALQPDGKVLVVGTTLADTSFAIARLGTGGGLDAGFGLAGRTTVSLGPRSAASSATLQVDGKLVVAGLVIDGGELNLGVARLLLASPPPVVAPGGGAPPPVVPRCAGRRATIVGTPGRDRLRGTRRADVIVALGDRDAVLARGGNDIVCGGAGDDDLRGGAGRDRLIAGSGRDRLIGGAGRDRLVGGPGRDRVRQ